MLPNTRRLPSGPRGRPSLDIYRETFSLPYLLQITISPAACNLQVIITNHVINSPESSSTTGLEAAWEVVIAGSSFFFVVIISIRMGNLTSKEKSNTQVKKIVDRVWDRFASTSEHQALGVQDLYCAILLVYNDINKTVPGPFNDPPTKEEVEELLRTYDKNDDGMLDRSEFTAFIETFTKNVSARVSTNILLFSFVIPTIVTLSRPGAEQLPLVGPVVRRAPKPIYSAIMTTLIVFAGSQFKRN